MGLFFLDDLSLAVDAAAAVVEEVDFLRDLVRLMRSLAETSSAYSTSIGDFLRGMVCWLRWWRDLKSCVMMDLQNEMRALKILLLLLQ